jgi:hypothetical protein
MKKHYREASCSRAAAEDSHVARKEWGGIYHISRDYPRIATATLVTDATIAQFKSR